MSTAQLQLKQAIAHAVLMPLLNQQLSAPTEMSAAAQLLVTARCGLQAGSPI
jgi:hypothetical protein